MLKKNREAPVTIRRLRMKEETPMKIVVLDGYTENPGDLSWDAIAALGELSVYDRTDRTDTQEIIRRIGSAEVVITNKTPITKEVMDACPTLKYVCVLATGYNVVDVDYAREKNIAVSNVPAYGTAAVAQHTIAMLLELCNHVAHHSDTVYAGRWEHCIDWCYWDHALMELDGKTLGIIGFGRIGQAIGRIARAFGMRVLAAGSRPSEEGLAIAEYTDLDTLLSSSDVIALHCPLTADNTGLINKDTISRMKDGVLLLNSARGGLIVEQDLADALNRGKVAGAGLDVVSTEPIRGDNPLLQAKNCFITPHIAWSPVEARQRILDCPVKNIQSYLAGSPVNTVN